MSETTQNPGKLVDIGAERAVLSALARYGSNFLLEIDDIIDAKTFTKDIHACTFNCFSKVLANSSQIDIPSVLSASNELGVSRFFEKTADLNALKAMWDFPILAPNAINLAKRIKRLQIARDCQQKLRDAWSSLQSLNGDEPIDEILDRFEGPIIELSTSLNTGADNNPIKLLEDAPEYFEYLADNPVSSIALSLGYPLLDAALGFPLRRKTVSLGSSRTSEGKSHLAKAICLHNARKGIPTLLFDSEMDKDAQVNRSIAEVTRVDLRSLETGQFGLNEENKQLVLREAKNLKDIPFYYMDCGGQTFDNILRIARRWIHNVVGKDENGNTKDCLIAYDYFKLTNSSQLNGLAEHDALGYQINQAHQFCKKYDVPLFTLVQLNRSGITDESLGAIAQSDKLSQNATTVFMFKPKSPEEVQEDGPENGNMKFIPLKTRFGSNISGGDYVCFQREGQFSTFREIKLKSQIVSSTDFAQDDSEPSEF